MELKDLRVRMDDIDNQLISLFRQRMELAGEIASFKKANDLPVFDPGTERTKLKSMCQQMPADLKNYTSVLYSSLFELSRSYQVRQVERSTELNERITHAIDNTPAMLGKNESVALCGTEGSFSQAACEKLFSMPIPMYFNNYEGIFSAISQGLCRYGVVPIEDTVEGSETQLYDLITKHGFSVIRATSMKAEYCLLGTGNSNPEEIFVTESGAAHCSQYISSLDKCVKITLCEHPAEAVSSCQNGAAIAPRSCAQLFGLRCLKRNVQDHPNSYIRYFCISKDLEIYPGADRSSIMLALPQQAGVLYRLLAKFYALGINIAKLESRPSRSDTYEALFYFELETSVYSQEFRQLICELSAGNEGFAYMGSYSEVV